MDEDILIFKDLFKRIGALAALGFIVGLPLYGLVRLGAYLFPNALNCIKSPKIEVVASPENLKGTIFVVDKKNPQTGQLEKDTVFMFSLKASDDFREAVTPLVKDGKVQIQQTVALKP